MNAHDPLDRAGNRIHVGDRVRIVAVPDLSGMSDPMRSETEAVFRHILGSYRRVAGFDESGNVWLRFTIRCGEHAGWHSVGMEPYLIRVVGRGSAIP